MAHHRPIHRPTSLTKPVMRKALPLNGTVVVVRYRVGDTYTTVDGIVIPAPVIEDELLASAGGAFIDEPTLAILAASDESKNDHSTDESESRRVILVPTANIIDVAYRIELREGRQNDAGKFGAPRPDPSE